MIRIILVTLFLTGTLLFTFQKSNAARNKCFMRGKNVTCWYNRKWKRRKLRRWARRQCQNEGYRRMSRPRYKYCNRRNNRCKYITADCR